MRQIAVYGGGCAGLDREGDRRAGLTRAAKDCKSVRTFFATRPYDTPEDERRFRGPAILTGWVFIALSSLVIADQLRLLLF
ncbi:hypothetical protein [Streptomyces sp. NPDC056661]|uniref:hypothetical protein n=1 Tax=Streptomyces sp. NPDC056661 TaxID=3345898 RepID=UPI0036AC342D